MTRPLSPEAQQLQDAINRAFAQVGEAFKKLGEPRYTMEEIRAALAVTRSFHDDVRDDDAFADYVGEELARARAAKL